MNQVPSSARWGLRELVWGVGVGLAAVVTYFWTRTPEPAATALDLVAALCEPGRHRTELVNRHVAAEVEVSGLAPDGGSGGHTFTRQEILRELEQLDRLTPGCAFDLLDWRLRPGGEGASWVEGVLEHSQSQPLDLHRSRRPVRALFSDPEGEPRLQQVVLGPFERWLPEARP